MTDARLCYDEKSLLTVCGGIGSRGAWRAEALMREEAADDVLVRTLHDLARALISVGRIFHSVIDLAGVFLALYSL